MADPLQQCDFDIGDLFAKHGITQLCTPDYKPTSFRHTRKIFTCLVNAEWNNQESDQAFLDVTDRMAAWVKNHDLSPYDKADVNRSMGYEIIDDKWSQISVQIDLYGTLED